MIGLYFGIYSCVKLEMGLNFMAYGGDERILAWLNCDFFKLVWTGLFFRVCKTKVCEFVDFYIEGLSARLYMEDWLELKHDWPE